MGLSLGKIFDRFVSSPSPSLSPISSLSSSLMASKMEPIYEALNEVRSVRVRTSSLPTGVAPIGLLGRGVSSLNWKVYDPLEKCMRSIRVQPNLEGAYHCQVQDQKSGEKSIGSSFSSKKINDRPRAQSIESPEEVVNWLIQAITNSLIEVPSK